MAKKMGASKGGVKPISKGEMKKKTKMSGGAQSGPMSGSMCKGKGMKKGMK